MYFDIEHVCHIVCVSVVQVKLRASEQATKPVLRVARNFLIFASLAFSERFVRLFLLPLAFSATNVAQEELVLEWTVFFTGELLTTERRILVEHREPNGRISRILRLFEINAYVIYI